MKDELFEIYPAQENAFLQPLSLRDWEQAAVSIDVESRHRLPHKAGGNPWVGDGWVFDHCQVTLPDGSSARFSFAVAVCRCHKKLLSERERLFRDGDHFHAIRWQLQNRNGHVLSTDETCQTLDLQDSIQSNAVDNRNWFKQVISERIAIPSHSMKDYFEGMIQKNVTSLVFRPEGLEILQKPLREETTLGVQEKLEAELAASRTDEKYGQGRLF